MYDVTSPYEHLKLKSHPMHACGSDTLAICMCDISDLTMTAMRAVLGPHARLYNHGKSDAFLLCIHLVSLLCMNSNMEEPRATPGNE